MRKQAVTGALAAGVLAVAPGAGAVQVDSLVGGSMANNYATCINIATLFIGADCSYANTRYPASSFTYWEGPFFANGFYPKGFSNVETSLTWATVPNDGKLAIPLSGTVTIDTQDTPAGTDDTISANLSFGAAVHNAQVGNADRAIETWDSFDHVLAPTVVNSATPNGEGGFDYVIGSRGRPTPAPLLLNASSPQPGDPFPSEYANASPVTTLAWWNPTGGASLPLAQRVGIERSVGYGNVGAGGGAGLQPNVGAQTTATFTNYTCLDGNGDNDCSTAELLFGSGQGRFLNENGTRNDGNGVTPNPVGNCSDGVDNGDGDGLADAADPQCAFTAPSPPGFENLILLVSTDAGNRVKTAEAYWTREYKVTSGNPIGDDPAAGPGAFSTVNSWMGGRFTFKGCSLSGPVAEDDTVSVVEGTTNGQLLVVTNDTLSCAEPNTITIIDGPDHGTATVNGTVIEYTPSTTEPAPNTFYDGPDTLTYQITDDDDIDSAVVTVNITVTVKAPTAANQSGTSQAGSAVSKTVITSGNAGSGAIGDHTVNPGAGTLGTCTASGAILTFTPTSGGGNGTGGCSYTITDADGDESNPAQFSVDVQGNSGSGGGGGGPQLPGGGSLDLLTLGALLAGLPLLARRRRS